MKLKLLDKLIMLSKLSLYGLVIQCFMLSSIWAEDISAQKIQSVNDVTVEMGFTKAKLEKVFKLLENQTDFHFSYSKEDIDPTLDITFDKGQTHAVRDVLIEVSKKSGLKFRQVNRNIIVQRPTGGNDNQKVVEIFIENVEVEGKITDENGEGLPGASVIEKGTTNGTTTDLDGNYKLNLPENASLVISFVGYKTQEVTIAGRSTIDVQMELDAEQLEEVVVVGYGSVKKSDLTGSVVNVGSEKIAYKPVTQVSQALAGEISGVTVEANSGAPGRNAANIRIRGLGTFSGAGNSPLVLVDGVPSTLDNLDPNNIESISVLKDASSAAIYGSRAANGVVLVTTKRGSDGNMKVTYHGYIGVQEPTEFPDFVSSAEYAMLRNEFLENSGQTAVWNDDQIELFRTQEDPDNFPNVNHYKDLFESGGGFQMGHNVSFAGGSDKNRYNFSVGYLQQDGLIAKNSFERYNFLANIDNKLSDKLELSIGLQGDLSNLDEPAGIQGGDMDDIINAATRLDVTFGGVLSDGTFGGNATFHSAADMASPSFRDQRRHHFLGSSKLTWKPIKGLSLSGRAGYNMNDINNILFNSTGELFGGVVGNLIELGPNKLTTTETFNSELIIDLFAKYKKSINDHNFSVMVGYNQDEFWTETSTASRDDFPTNTLFRLNAGAAGNQQNSGIASEWALQSYFGRLQYDFKGKYLLTVNARYDGSSRFPEDNRWGFFPSVAGAWRISDEDFLSSVKPINNLKLRVSWGQLGNQQVGNYPYQSVLSLGRDYPFGTAEALQSGAALVNLANQEISWETTSSLDIGLDAAFFDGKLNLVVDYFDKQTTDILYSITTATTLGLNPSEVNAGAVSNKGWEFEIGHRNDLGEFSYGVNMNFSVVKNQVEELADVEQDIAGGLFVGEPLNAVYGYVSDGLFVDQGDIDNYPTQPFATQPGLIRFRDINGPDGVPDGVVDAVHDRKVIGSRFPKYTFGGNITAGYKGFDLVAQVAGTGGMVRSLAGHNSIIFNNNATPQRWQVEDRWTAENPNPAASNPLIRTSIGQFSNSDFWLINASYFRLKNLQFGYSLPEGVLEKLNMDRLRVYVAGSNLLTFDSFYEGWDPEPTNPGSLTFYPLTSVYTLGINATF